MILALDTTGDAVSAALIACDCIRSESFAKGTRMHVSTLMPMVEDTLVRGGASLADVAKIACVTGPGSFTGVRIGVATARALAFARGLTIVGVDALEALCAGVYFWQGSVCALLDARRGQVYGALFHRAGDALVRILDDEAAALEDWLARCPEGERTLFVGDGARAYCERISEALGARAAFAPNAYNSVRASVAGLLARTRAGVAPELLVPIYLRASQAERELIAKRRSPDDG